MGWFAHTVKPVAPTRSLYHYKATQSLKKHDWNVCCWKAFVGGDC